jgi:hypothetical protein
MGNWVFKGGGAEQPMPGHTPVGWAQSAEWKVEDVRPADGKDWSTVKFTAEESLLGHARTPDDTREDSGFFYVTTISFKTIPFGASVGGAKFNYTVQAR